MPLGPNFTIEGEMEFVLPIDPIKFRSTNQAWNDLQLNDPWSVGYVTSLIELKPFLNKEAWEEFYSTSGNERERLVSGLDPKIQAILQNETFIRTDKGVVQKLAYSLKNLNFQFGKTKDQLIRKGEILYGSVKNNGFGVTVEECYQCVRYRVICETWNGIIVRERNTIRSLQRIFPNLLFRKTLGEFDHKYAVDYEVINDGKLAYALQIKPKSYTGNAPYLITARQANYRKNLLYKIYTEFRFSI
jgi:hypothetical protein